VVGGPASGGTGLLAGVVAVSSQAMSSAAIWVWSTSSPV